MLDVDAVGFDLMDRKLLEAILFKFGGGPVGLSTLAISVSEPTETVEDVYEPFLLQCGFLNRTPRGRIATAAAYAHLGIPYPGEKALSQAGLWDAPGDEPIE